MTTIEALVSEIDRQLLSHYTRPVLDTPAATFTAGASEIKLSTVDTMAPGSVLDCGFELMYVKTWNEATRTATVIRGLHGSTARAGVTTDLVKINPRISSVAMVDAIRDEIRSWDSRIYAVELDSVSFGASSPSMEVTPSRDPYRVLSVRPQPQSSTDQRGWVMAELRRGEAVGQFASGYSLHLPPGMIFGAATVADVTWAMPFNLTTLATTTDLQATVGLADTMLEILKWGVLYRILAGNQEARLEPFGTVRSDIEQSVPAMSALQAASQFKRMRDDAYDVEVRRLLNRYPVRTAG